ncbi:MAG: type II toxin-antitoxin system PemK/MazF family toxin [Rhodospirillales bacterium]|nr:type II toxin-antitoxin system PemK/MazF family toxin [Rhodospirillales bacterium]
MNLDPPPVSELRKTRPAVVLSADALNRARRTVVIVPLSTGPTPRPPIVIASPSAGDGAVAVCDQIRAVDKGRLIRRERVLDAADMRRIEAELRTVLEL